MIDARNEKLRQIISDNIGEILTIDQAIQALGKQGVLDVGDANL